MFPKVKQKISKRIKNIFYPEIYTEIKNPFTIEQSALMLAKTLKDIGNHKKFAPIIIILGHGSKSVNNPFAAAYNCGACGGREGGP